MSRHLPAPAAPVASAPGAAALWVVATPIGNLGDLSPRAVETLRSVQLVLAEDTRHSRPLLQQFGIDTPLLALHEHNEAATAEQLVMRMRGGEAMALISDAGTPLISDPGFRLVQAARAAGLPVRPVPGPCALIAALCVAGIGSDRFCFEGFLPSRRSARREALAGLRWEPRTLVFYESAHRIRESLQDLVEVFGPERRMLLARELTKRFETLIDGSIDEVSKRVVADADQQRGEFVLVLEGAPVDTDARLSEGRRLYAKLAEHLPPSQAARLAAEISGAPRKALYPDFSS
jgi:16S rRNA (cytidine1402-2'-O)-methyltransferase